MKSNETATWDSLEVLVHPCIRNIYFHFRFRLGNFNQITQIITDLEYDNKYRVECGFIVNGCIVFLSAWSVNEKHSDYYNRLSLKVASALCQSIVACLFCYRIVTIILYTENIYNSFQTGHCMLAKMKEIRKYEAKIRSLWNISSIYDNAYFFTTLFEIRALLMTF